MKKQLMSLFALFTLLVIASHGWTKTASSLDGVINVNTASTEELIQRTRKRHSEAKSPEEIYLLSFDDPYVQNFEQHIVDSKVSKNDVTFGHYTRMQEEEFGNPNQNELLLIYGQNFLSDSPSGNWKTAFMGEKLEQSAQAFAEVTAHETGHSLGLEHPGRRYKRNSYHLMDTAGQRLLDRSRFCRFNDFALEYFRYILGVKEFPE